MVNTKIFQPCKGHTYHPDFESEDFCSLLSSLELPVKLIPGHVAASYTHVLTHAPADVAHIFFALYFAIHEQFSVKW